MKSEFISKIVLIMVGRPYRREHEKERKKELLLVVINCQTLYNWTINSTYMINKIDMCSSSPPNIWYFQMNIMDLTSCIIVAVSVNRIGALDVIKLNWNCMFFCGLLHWGNVTYFKHTKQMQQLFVAISSSKPCW